ncbi:MAG: DUF1987 domain-containing protein [Bacteroidales bacterium]|nr:DUF1987 domain-containing protein [Bacteroidales bacterium]
MEPLFLDATEDSPEINFNKSKKIFSITGRSLPEDVISFYTPVFSWLEQYVADPAEETNLKVKVDYFNSASQRALNEIFIILNRIAIKGKKVKIDWYYNEEDEEMKEAGEEYADITKLSFNYISYVP